MVGRENWVLKRVKVDNRMRRKGVKGNGKIREERERRKITK